MGINIDNNRKHKGFNWNILFIITSISIIMGIYRDGFSALFPFIQREFDLQRSQLGLISSLFFFLNTLAAIFSGRLVDIKGSRWGLVTGSFLLGIFIIFHSLVPNYFVLLIVAALTGLAVSTNYPSTTKGIIEWFPRKWVSTALGFQSTGFPLGGVLAAIFLPSLGVLIGWRKSILFPGVLALLYSFFLFIFYKDKKKDNIKKDDAKIDIPSIWKNLHQIFKNSELMRVSILGFFLGITSGSIAAHFALFLFLDYSLTEQMAGLGLAMVQIGSVVGRPTWGLICDKVLERNKNKAFLCIGLLSAAISLIFSISIKYFVFPIGVIFVLAFLAGFSGRGWHGLFFASIAELVSGESVGISSSFSSIFFRCGLMFGPPFFGYIADIRRTYDLSWFILGLIMSSATISQYLFYVKAKNKVNKS